MSTAVAKKTDTKQLNVRVPMDLFEQVQDVATSLGIDPSHLLRLMLVEKLPEYRERGERGALAPKGDS